MKKLFCIVFVVILISTCVGCSKTYTLSSIDIYAVGGQKLKGNGMVDATLTLGDSKIQDDASIELVYAGNTYRGTVHYPYVFWETEPYIFADSSSMYTEISGGGNTIYLTFNALVNDIWFESRQVYKAK